MVEFKEFGWNALTLSFLATVIFAVLGVWGLKDQIKKIWSNQSGKSASLTTFSVLLALFISYLIYGIQQQSLALILSGLIRTPFLIAVLIGLWKFKGATRQEMIIIVTLSLALLYMPFSSDPGILFLIFTYLGVAATLLQAWEIWKKKSAGVVSIKMLVIYELSVTFWAVYGLALDNTRVLVMGLSYVMAYTITIVLWFVYRERT